MRLIFFYISSLALVAQISVNPSGVNVNHAGPTTVFLTYSDTDGFLPVEAIWCGETNPDNSPVEGTILGRLALRHDFSAARNNHLTDIMTIPDSVIRAAYLDAKSGATSSFFYVRRFQSVDGKANLFVRVTCRLAGNGARVPLALTYVNLRFDTDQEITQLNAEDSFPPIFADIRYNGTGLLKGRWEIVLPEDEAPSELDLRTQGSLNAEQRSQQRSYLSIGSFSQVLAPGGQFTLAGPNVKRLPRHKVGTYTILLRIDATDEKEGNSSSLEGTLHSGAVAGFPLPVLRYQVSQERLQTENKIGCPALQPADGGIWGPGAEFVWGKESSAAIYEWELRQKGKTQFSARVTSPHYQPPPWLRQSGSFSWRVIAFNLKGEVLTKSNWNSVVVP